MKYTPILIFLSFLVASCCKEQEKKKIYSPYIYKVFDYSPAPGQYINELPLYEIGNTKADMIAKAEQSLVNNNRGLVSLGGFGGYIIFGFDHPVVNVSDSCDFLILGNAALAIDNSGVLLGGSAEPGIIMVSYDVNNNGLPDDIWYEIAGSEYNDSKTKKKYAITFFKPNENKEKTLDSLYSYIIDNTYIKWIDNNLNTGYLSKNKFHNQSYYPQWITDTILHFEGTLLANNYTEINNYYVQKPYLFGYADNLPNNDSHSNIDIEWAVDEHGNSANLKAIHFVKVYTGINQYCGWIGETSTEIMGAIDLHFIQK
ncbi:hypothetical protein FACS1894153_3190 [Bacteroidia bacterium]|nr:hypothetical protein FACS1894153_3190 [Bacteroidia bacterium]